MFWIILLVNKCIYSGTTWNYYTIMVLHLNVPLIWSENVEIKKKTVALKAIAANPYLL